MEIFQKYNNAGFSEKSLEVFGYQSRNVPVYKQFIHHLGINPDTITSIDQIPFLPIDLFKSQKILVEGKVENLIFESSGTGGMERSRHYVADPLLYEQSFTETFRYFYGEPSEWCFIALLPSYLERGGSSLIYMCDHLIKLSGYKDSGFYLYDFESLAEKLVRLQNSGQKTLLIGVSFALYDFAEKYKIEIPDIVIMETGGMKGRKKEILRQELHDHIKTSFGVKSVHSEYGMTELFSQSYSLKDGIFSCPPWMKVFTAEIHDPFHLQAPGETGTLNIIDLANLNSCSFIATSDLGKTNVDGSFEVLGRLDNSDIRGCNLLVV
jgi:phenylacetate-coenzyme A ligase PaaK-like adenylate-forming protein